MIVFDNWFFVCILTGGGTYSRGGRGCDGRAEGTKTVGARPHFSVPERRAETASETAPSRHETGLGRIDLNSINHKLCFCSVQIACLSRHDPTTHDARRDAPPPQRTTRHNERWSETEDICPLFTLLLFLKSGTCNAWYLPVSQGSILFPPILGNLNIATISRLASL